MKLVSALRPTIPVARTASARAVEPASELELQCWELWAPSVYDVAWFAAVTLVAAVWVLLLR